MTANPIVAGSDVQLDELPGHLFRRLHQLAVARFTADMETISLTPIQWAALVITSQRPGLDQSTLSREIYIDTSTVAGVLDRLEARGLIERKPSPDDRRLRLVHVSEQGETLLLEATAAVLHMQAWLLEPLSATERTVFMKLMLKVLERRE
jgi:DNA-binding MarR family transcriptional regulator